LKSQSAVGVEVEGALRDVLPLALQVIPHAISGTRR
jgi:hypothetical protein